MPARSNPKISPLLTRWNFILFFILVFFTFLLKDYFINSQREIDEDHGEIVRVLSEQNMLSQRITKLALLIQNDLDYDTVANSRPDSLARLVPRWVANHEWLLKNNRKHTADDSVAVRVSRLINQATPYVREISSAGQRVLDYRLTDRVIFDKAVSIIDRKELPYHDLIDRSIKLYTGQMEAEYTFLNSFQYALTVLAMLFLSAGFFFLIVPLFKEFQKEIANRKEVEGNLTKAVQKYLESEVVLSQSKKELEEINEAIGRSALVTITDTDGNILKANKLFCDLSGYSEEELIGKNHRVVSAHHHDKNFWIEFWSTIKSGKSWRGEVKNRTKDGREIWLDTVINPIMGSNGVIRQFLAIRTDITNRKVAEKMVEDRDNELRAISGTILPVGIISTDTDGNIVLFSKGAEALLGYTADEMIGKTPAVFHDLDEVMARNAELTRELRRPVGQFETFVVISEKSGFESRQWTYIKKDGARIPVQLVVSPIKNSSGVTTGYVGIAVDIRDRIDAENAILFAKERAEEANRSKSQFLANMSHEIRTPLNSILGFAELLSGSVQEPKQRTQVNTIITNGKILLALINDLLNIAKIEAGKMDLELGQTDLIKTAGEVSQMFSTEIKARNLHHAVEIQKGFPLLFLADEQRIRQVLVNLVGNAVKFTHQGFVRIFLESSPIPNKPGYCDLSIKVQDSGIGIDSKHHQQVFEAFHQVLDTTTSQYGGTGLGLTISKKLVGLMGGSIHLESEFGKGSTFTVFLPSVQILQDSVSEPVSIPVSPVDKLKPAIQNKTILIVDDFESNINLVIDYLEECPCNKLIARGGAEAVLMARQHLPDLILMDLKMPGMDGWEATRQIRQIPSMENKPILACTANVIGVKESNTLFNGFIFKPFGRTVLLEELQKYLQASENKVINEVKIDDRILKELNVRFSDRLAAASTTFEVGLLEQILKELSEYLDSNPVPSLTSLLVEAKTNLDNFDLDALSANLEYIRSVIAKSVPK